MRSVLFIALMLIAPLGAAQIPGLTKPAAASAPPDQPVDPLGRSTPRGAIVGFSRAMDRTEISSAARYLQLDASQLPNAQALAIDLKTLIDSELREGIGQISDLPSGSLDDGLDENQEHVGPFHIQNEKLFITLVRVTDPEDGRIWLVSTDTLRQIPTIARAAGKSAIEHFMPAALLDRELFGLSLAHWIVLVGLLVVTFSALWLIGLGIDFLARLLLQTPERRRRWDAWFQATRWPAAVVLTLIIQFVAIPPLGFPLTFRVGYARVGLFVLIITLTWLLKRVLSLVFEHARSLVRGKDRASTTSLMMLTERMIQALIIVVAIIALLIVLGVESKTALAGLGFVGVALALGAQKTVENLLGGVFILSDKALAVGDYCTIGTQSGTIEDVTLRSVRLRTADQSLVSLPAGSLAQAGIENFASRRKYLAQTTLRLRYGTDVGQLRRILGGIRALLDADPNIEKGTDSIRLVNFGVDAIELRLFAYFLTANDEQFRTWREALLLEVAAVIESAGSALAPTHFVVTKEESPPKA